MAQYIRVNLGNSALIKKSLPNSSAPFGEEAELIHYYSKADESAFLCQDIDPESTASWEYKYSPITNAYLRIRAYAKDNGIAKWAEVDVRCLSAPYNPETVTWNNAPELFRPWPRTVVTNVFVSGNDYYQYDLPKSNSLSDIELSNFAKQVIKTGCAIINYEVSSVIQTNLLVKTQKAGNLMPYMFITVDDSITVTSQVIGSSKTSGYYRRNVAQTFSWVFDKTGSYYCVGDWTQVSAVFHWRNGTSGSWNDVSISGSNQSVTITANTFPLSNAIQWYVSAVDNVGTASDSPVYTISTADSLTTATPISPIGTVEDGNGDIILTWTDANDNGTTPTGADLQYSQDGETWTQFGHVDGAVTTYTAPGGTFPAGSILWRVRAYNADAAAGPWSEAANFISIAAPGAPSVSAAAVPFTTVTWQSSGQQAYRITIDGVTYGPFFGTAKTYTPNDYLRDGIHTISVEIQGVYGLWSQAGSVTFTIANSPGDGITLSGSFDRDAALSWTTTSTTADFLVYRDDKQIAATSVTGYTDRFVLGAHSYQVINRLPDGNYTASNIVNGVMRSCTTAIAPFNGGAWQELKLSENSYSEQRFSWAKLSSTRHVTGAVYPVIEVSEYEDAAGSYDVSFPDVESANAFLALRGHIVILKSRGGNVVIGALTQIEQANKDFYISFAFTIQRIDWEDYVDAQNS